MPLKFSGGGFYILLVNNDQWSKLADILTLILVPDRRSGHNNSKTASTRSHTYLW